jgi:hypothetical protein
VPSLALKRKESFDAKTLAVGEKEPFSVHKPRDARTKVKYRFQAEIAILFALACATNDMEFSTPSSNFCVSREIELFTIWACAHCQNPGLLMEG